MILHQSFSILFYFVGISFSLGYLFWQTKRAEDQAQLWAKQNQFQIMQSHRVWFPPIRKCFKMSRAQVIIRVSIRDLKAGRQRGGLLRVGNYWRGTWGTPEFHIDWDAD